jgi:hypothetical protein
MNLNKKTAALAAIMAAAPAAEAAVVHHFTGTGYVDGQNAMGLNVGDMGAFDLAFGSVGPDTSADPNNFTGALNGVSGTFTAGSFTGSLSDFSTQIVKQSPTYPDLAVFEGTVNDYNGVSLTLVFVLNASQFNNIDSFESTFAQLKNGEGQEQDFIAIGQTIPTQYAGFYDRMDITAYDETVPDGVSIDEPGSVPLIGTAAALAYLARRKRAAL